MVNGISNSDFTIFTGEEFGALANGDNFGSREGITPIHLVAAMGTRKEVRFL
jgi:hypothetical protein